MEAFPAIMLVTGDEALAAALPAQLLHRYGTEARIAADWDAFSAALHPLPPALAVVDFRLNGDLQPRLDALRKQHPLLALVGIAATAQDETPADFSALPLTSWLSRPVSIPQLIRTLERLHHRRMLTAGQQELTFAEGCLFRPAEKTMHHGERRAELTDKESSLLACLYHHRHDWLPREALLEEVWGYGGTVDTHTLETHLYRLRGKLRPLFGEGDPVLTRQSAYRLNPAILPAT